MVTMNAWLFYFLKRSISERSGRFLISLAAVMLTITAVTALLILSLGIRGTMGAELRRYGSNMIVTDRSGKELPVSIVGEIAASVHVKDAVPQIYGVSSCKQQPIAVTGTEPGKMTGIRLQGRLPQSDDELMIGARLSGLLQVKAGTSIKLGPSSREFAITGVFDQGSDEDGTVVMPLEPAARLLGLTGVSAVLLNVEPGRLEDVENLIARMHPALEVRTVRQVAVAEERILSRIQLLMTIVTAVVLFFSLIALTSTMSAQVIERREEIGLMKAIGATGSDIRRIFFFEAGCAGSAGAVAGFGAGAVAAEIVSFTAFGAFVPVNMLIAPLSIVLGMGVAAAGTYLPVRAALRVNPALTLRGE